MTGQPWQDSRDRTVVTGQPWQDSRDMTVGQERTAGAKVAQGSWDRTAGTQQHEVLRQPVKILKHSARGKLKLINLI